MVSVIAVIVVLAGLGLLAYSLVLGEDSLVPRAVSSASKGEELASSAPKDTTLQLTIPKMARVEDLPVYDSPWDSEDALDVSAAHLDSSGFPWEDGSNVYISGHRMGFPGTKSFLVFYDLDALENGDEIYLTDSNGTKYTYKVFKKYNADPYDWSPTDSIPGKNVVTLQTCTLPDYTNRLIIQAELTETTPGNGSSSKTESTSAEPTQNVGPVPGEPDQDIGPVPGQYLGPGPVGPGPIVPEQDIGSDEPGQAG
jgi:sortase A